MNTHQTISGHLVADSTYKIAIVASRFNQFIVTQLVEGAVDTLIRHGVTAGAIDIIYAPGAFELPLVIKQAIQRDEYTGVVAVGAIIRGGTPHFDYVASSCIQGIAAVSLELNTPVSLGVLTTETIEQAIERAGTKAGNKGADAAVALLETLSVCRQLGKNQHE